VYLPRVIEVIEHSLSYLQHCTEHTLPPTTLYQTHSSIYKTLPNTLFHLNTITNTHFYPQECTKHTLPPKHCTEHTLLPTTLYRTHSSTYTTIPTTSSHLQACTDPLLHLQDCTEHTLPPTRLYPTHSSTYKTVPNTLLHLQVSTEHTVCPYKVGSFLVVNWVSIGDFLDQLRNY
jgi:hypothetical protein